MSSYQSIAPASHFLSLHRLAVNAARNTHHAARGKQSLSFHKTALRLAYLYERPSDGGRESNFT